MRDLAAKPGTAELKEAVSALTALAYFPAGEGAAAAIMRLLDRMVRTNAQLQWLVDTLIDQVGKWPGTAEVRGLFCTRFAPADGVEAHCSLPSFSPADMEARQALMCAQEKLLLPAPGEPASADASIAGMVCELAKVKAMPGTPQTRIRARSSVKNYLANAEPSAVVAATREEGRASVSPMQETRDGGTLKKPISQGAVASSATTP